MNPCPRSTGKALLPRPWSVAVLAAAALAAVAGAVWGSAKSANDPPAPASAARDVRLALQVRRALMEDDALVRANIGVKVVDGVVHLWGPIATSEQGRRAVDRARAVPGVRAVRNELYCSAALEEPPTIRFPTQPEPATASQSAFPDSAAPPLGKVTGRAPPIALPPSGRSATAPPSASPDAAPPRPVIDPNPAAGQRPDRPAASPLDPSRPPSNAHAISLLPPIADSAAPQLPAANTPPQAMPPSIAAEVERLRQADARFRGIRAEIRGSTVLVAAAADVPGDKVMAFAQALSRLSGVGRVLIQSAPPTSP